MTEKVFLTGNEAVGLGAINAGCHAFFGYPITPQNEIIAWFAREMPKRGKVFVQTHAETGSINMLIGGAVAGARAITSTSSVGWDLMQEGMSNMVWTEAPGVILLVQRGGPGQGHPRRCIPPSPANGPTHAGHPPQPRAAPPARQRFA